MGQQAKLSETGSAVVVDDSHYPYLIATWFGAPAVDTIEFYFAWQAERLARARDEGIKVATIIDGIEASRPSPSIRKTLAELSKSILDEFDPYIVHSWVILQNPLIRGVITAITWMTPMRTSTAPTPVLALQAGARALLQENIPIPAGFDPSSYTRPDRPTGKARRSAS